MRRFAFPEQWERAPGLERRVHELLEDGRHRTALDEVLRHLREDTGSIGALSLALVLVGLGRTESLRAAEPMTDVQRWCALLAPITTQCTHCRVAWYSNHVLLANAGVVDMAIANPVGLQCQECRYSLCRDCLERRRRQSRTDFRGVEPVDAPCPASGCGGVLATPVLPTGCHDVMGIDPDDIEAVVVVRDGLIPPTMDDALVPVTKFLPLIADDAPIIHIRRSVLGMMTDDATRDELASSLLRELEREEVVAPAASVRSDNMFIRAGEANDTDYLIVVVRKDVRRSRASSRNRAEQATYTYLLQILPRRGGWGTLRDSCSGDFVRGSFGVITAAEDALADVAHDVMKRFDNLSLERRVLFFTGDRTTMNLSMDDVCGVVVQGGDFGTP